MALFDESDKKGGKVVGPHLVMQFDGGSRGNPGPAGIGVTLKTEKGEMVYELAEFLGECTNNVAEYTAFLRGLTAATALGAAKLTVRSDSELLVRQINGVYKVKSPDLKPLYQKAIDLMSRIGSVNVQHVYRESNSRADELANMAMDTRKKIEPLGAAAPGSAAKIASQPAKNNDSSEPEYPILHFPAGFTDRTAQEAETRGFLAGAQVELADGTRHGVHFTNASRLAYDLEEESRLGRPYLAPKGLIVLQAVTKANMTKAVRALVDTEFFSS